MKYKLEKKIWTDADFEQMGWHDCHIYKIRVAEDLEMDIDYILKWNEPELQGLPYTFWVAPATLVFKQVKSLVFDINTALKNGIDIDEIGKRASGDGILWHVATQQGDFEFECEGFEQFIRQEPLYLSAQTIPFAERGGISLERTTSQQNTGRQKEIMNDARNTK